MTRHQRWAKGALELVLKHKDQPQEGDYRTLCMKMPVLINAFGSENRIQLALNRRKPISNEDGSHPMLFEIQSELRKLLGNCRLPAHPEPCRQSR